MVRAIHHFIDGAVRPGTSGRTADVMNPSTGAVQAQVDLATAGEVHAVIANAAQAQPGWAHGIRACGPASLGLINTGLPLNATPAPAVPAG
ncbi:aldehyde dehydrogenase family protein, partial [Corynebacterium sp.]|uniref:aldehyde dehydrogenase family protein n=1 Tax=Corynebacterium sp. TaxID=1720 RepID=UPI0019A7B6CA